MIARRREEEAQEGWVDHGDLMSSLPFAMMEAVLIVARLAQTYRFVLDPKQVVEPLPKITMSPRYGLDMMIEKRQPVLQQTEDAETTEQASAEGCPFHTKAA